MEKKASVVSISDEKGIDHVDLLRTALINEAKFNRNGRVKLTFFLKALQYLGYIDKSELQNHKTTLTIVIDGVSQTEHFLLVKPLSKQPIYELRISLPQLHCWIRATFFPKYYHNQLYYCFAKGFVKTRNPDYDPTNDMIQQTYLMYKKVQRDPGKYLSS
ncbi:hypothetical protein [Salisediminibacterium beveridgei]|uniref:hypothetical protein n=1 Tax=Salisediminibacterium beveridgei TaxID=632773 RepID=UPI000847DAA4|nr:hypothetical protein [Salisediminibacterium beveridgei]